MTTIGILASQLRSTQQDPFWWNRVTYTRQRFIDVLQGLGHTAILFPVDKSEKATEMVGLVDKILLTGGTDVDPRFYNEDPDPKLEGANPRRDAFEIAAIKAAISQKKAVLGICRGLQVLNVALGGTLYQDLSYSPSKLKHRQAPTPQEFDSHSVQVARDGLLSFLPQQHFVNSFHHQAIKELSPELTAIATAPDGIIEAVENKEKRLLAVQWHPESDHETNPENREIFRFFAEEL
jgi:putative glutamine amidotransferase